jgi:hypothetical protein
MDTCVVCGGYVVEGSQICKKCMDRHGLTETLTPDEMYLFRQIREETVKWFNGEVSAERFAEKTYGLLNNRKEVL